MHFAFNESIIFSLVYTSLRMKQEVIPTLMGVCEHLLQNDTLFGELNVSNWCPHLNSLETSGDEYILSVSKVLYR